MSGVTRWRLKPPPPEHTEITAAVFEPGENLAAVAKVAGMADYRAEAAQVDLPSAPVLLVRYRNLEAPKAPLDWLVVPAGYWLCYSAWTGGLFCVPPVEMHARYCEVAGPPAAEGVEGS